MNAEWRLNDALAALGARLLLDAAKARRELGWRPRLNLDAEVDWTVAWCRCSDPTMARRATVTSTAFATNAYPMENFAPSAKLATNGGLCPHWAAKPACGAGVR